jgi:hypothetical protein
VKIETNRNLSNMSMSMRSLSTVCNNAVYSRSDLVVGSPSRVPLSFGGMPGMQECVECRFVVFTPAARKPLTDLSQMNIRSAPFHKESTCQISYPYAKAFDMISCLQNYDKKRKNTKKQSKNIMVAAR